MKVKRRIPTLGDGNIWPFLAQRLGRKLKPKLGRAKVTPAYPFEIVKEGESPSEKILRSKKETATAVQQQEKRNKKARKVGCWRHAY